MSDDGMPVMGDDFLDERPLDLGTEVIRLRAEVARLTAERDGAVDQWVLAEQENTRLLTERARDMCPYVRQSDEGTAYCLLDGAAAEVARLTADVKQLTAERNEWMRVAHGLDAGVLKAIPDRETLAFMLGRATKRINELEAEARLIREHNHGAVDAGDERGVDDHGRDFVANPAQRPAGDQPVDDAVDRGEAPER